MTDVQCHRIPNIITGLSAAALTTVFTVGGVLTGDWSPFLRALLASILAGLVLGTASALFSLGMGDTKLGISVAGLLGWHGWLPLFHGTTVMLATAFIAATTLMARGRSRTSHLPFGPFMVIGAIAGILLATW